MSRTRALAALAALLACAALVAFGVVVASVNAKYPAPPVNVHVQGEAMPFPGAEGVTFKVARTDVLARDGMASALPEAHKDTQEWARGDFFAIIVHVEVTNASGQDWAVHPLREFMISVGATYSNGIDPAAGIELAHGDPVAEVKPGQSAEVPLVCIVAEKGFPLGAWQGVRERPFYLVYSLYPSIEKVQLEAQ